MNSKYEKWNKTNTQNLIKFIQANELILVENFYNNIKKGVHVFRKPFGFFIQMSKFVNKSPQQCKSKFQKLEKKIYIKFLDIPQIHYNLYLLLRKQKHSNILKIRNSQSPINDLNDNISIPRYFKFLQYQINLCIEEFGIKKDRLKSKL